MAAGASSSLLKHQLLLLFGVCLGFRVLHMQQAVGQFNGTPSPHAHYVFSLSFQVSTLQSHEA
jgi:hypothetical protein